MNRRYIPRLTLHYTPYVCCNEMTRCISQIVCHYLKGGRLDFMKYVGSYVIFNTLGQIMITYRALTFRAGEG